MTRAVGKKKQAGGAFSDYQTPPWAIERYLETYPSFLLQAERILEPNAGEGRIVNALDDFGYTGEIWAFEIQKRYQTHLEDSAAQHVHMGDCFDLIDEYPGGGVLITNPAFPIAHQMLQAYWSLVDHIVLLQKIDFLGSTDRYAFISQHVPHTCLLPERPKFTGSNTDQTYYAWYHWETAKPRTDNVLQILRDTPKEVRCKRPRRKS